MCETKILRLRNDGSGVRKEPILSPTAIQQQQGDLLSIERRPCVGYSPVAIPSRLGLHLRLSHAERQW